MIGRLISHFEVVARLGEGGMGVVYKARDTSLDRFVALKVLQPYAVADPERRRRFVQEAKSASALNHPNIVHIYEIGEHEGSLFIAMEYVDGYSLNDLILGKEPLALPLILRISVQIADALATAHASGIVHRDLKPSNIMISQTGLAKLVDFGLAKLVEAPAEEEVSQTEETRSMRKVAPRTQEGTVIGTAPYMSPEQAEGKKVDARSDIFSFGAVLYETLTGKRAFSGATRMATLTAVMREEPAPVSQSVPDAPVDLVRVIDRCLRKDLGRRAQNMSDVKIQLEEIREGSSSAPHSAATVAVSQTTAPVVRRPFLPWMIAAAVLVIAGIGFYMWRGQSARPIDSLAVLPFLNAANDPNTEYLSDGVTENLTNSLAQLPNLRVAPRMSSLHFKDADPKRAAAELGVRALLTGSVRQQGDALAISVELIDAADNRHIWGQRYDRKTADLAAIQQQITSDVADKLDRKLGGVERQQIAKRYSTNSEAYRQYLEGHYLLEKITPEGISKGLELMRQAIDKDPTFAPAYEGLSYGYWMPVDLFTAPQEGMPKAKVAAAKALELDDTLAEAHLDMGCILFMYDYDWPRAGKELQRALELKPDYARGHELYGWYLISVGRVNEGAEESRKAVQLDPLNAETNWQVGLNLHLAHQDDETIQLLDKGIEMSPNFWPSIMTIGQAYAAKRELPRAIEQFQQARKIEPDAPWPLAELGHAYAVSGKKVEAEKALQELLAWRKRTYITTYHMAQVYLGLGNRDQAMANLEKAYEERSTLITFLPMDPEMDPLRADPRFKDLLKKVGLSEK